jgi:hypothetical protein
MSTLINLGLSRLSYSDLRKFGVKIHDGFIAQVAKFPAPNPLMVDFQTDIDTLDAANVTWGDKKNHGTHNDHVALLTAVTVVKDDLRMLSAYAQNTQPTDTASWEAVGFTLKRPKSEPKPLQMVQQFRRLIGRTLVDGNIKLKWKRPFDTDRSDVKVYVLQWNSSGVRPDLLGGRGIINGTLVTDTSIIIAPPYVGANYFWVTPYNAKGFGVSSEPVFYNAPGKIE